MKTALILLAISLALVLGLAMGLSFSDRTARPFTFSEEVDVRARYPGGAILEGRVVYRTCENGQEVRRYADGRVLWFPQRTCWR